MLTHSRRRWPVIETALCDCIVFYEVLFTTQNNFQSLEEEVEETLFNQNYILHFFLVIYNENWFVDRVSERQP